MVVVETVNDASRNAATLASVLVQNGGGSILVEVDHDGSKTSSDLAVHLADTVGALDGQLVVGRDSRPGGDVVRVVVADDSLLTREGIVHLLRDAGVDVVAEAEDADRLLDQFDRSPTSPSSTSGCRRRTPTKVCAPPNRSATTTLMLGCWFCPSTSSRATRAAPRAHPERSATCSRSAFLGLVLVDAIRRVTRRPVVDPTIVRRCSVGAGVKTRSAH